MAFELNLADVKSFGETEPCSHPLTGRTQKSTFRNNKKRTPDTLWVTVLDSVAKGMVHTNPVAHCTGRYVLQSGKKPNGFPVWENSLGTRLLYSTPNGYWAITDSHADLHIGLGYIHSSSKHMGKLPDEVEYYGSYVKEMRAKEISSAREASGGKVWSAKRPDVVVSSAMPLIHGFRYGRVVRSACDITEKGEVKVAIGCLGVIIGPSTDPSALRVKFDSVDAPYNVHPSEVDLADGPRLLVRGKAEDGVWRKGRVVNITGDMVKIHIEGQAYTTDDWYPKDSPFLRPLRRTEKRLSDISNNMQL